MNLTDENHIYDFDDNNSGQNRDQLEHVTNQLSATVIKREKLDEEIENNTMNLICNNQSIQNTDLTKIRENWADRKPVVKSEPLEPLEFPGKPKNSERWKRSFYFKKTGFFETEAIFDSGSRHLR